MADRILKDDGRPADGGEEGVPGIGRVEHFSDGVIAIIITIMVLELKAPEQEGLEHLFALWPIMVAYVLSFAFIDIYWVNHHRLFSHATKVTNRLIWANMALLFMLSLVPFSTAYLGTHEFGRTATIVYLLTMLLPAIAYVPLQHAIRDTGVRGPDAHRYHRRGIRKGLATAAIYAAGIPLSFVTPWLGIACAALVAVLWFLPTSPLDALFDTE